MRKCLQTRVANGGAIPKCLQLHDCYLFDVYEKERAALKELVANKQVALIVDKLSDSERRFVLDVMAVFLTNSPQVEILLRGFLIPTFYPKPTTEQCHRQW